VTREERGHAGLVHDAADLGARVEEALEGLRAWPFVHDEDFVLGPEEPVGGAPVLLRPVRDLLQHRRILRGERFDLLSGIERFGTPRTEEPEWGSMKPWRERSTRKLALLRKWAGGETQGRDTPQP